MPALKILGETVLCEIIKEWSISPIKKVFQKTMSSYYVEMSTKTFEALYGMSNKVEQIDHGLITYAYKIMSAGSLSADEATCWVARPNQFSKLLGYFCYATTERGCLSLTTSIEIKTNELINYGKVILRKKTDSDSE